MGQLVRGGRSWPPDMNVGAGAESPGNHAEVTGSGSGMPGQSLGSVGLEHEAEQVLHLSWPAWSPAWPP